ncbi:MAG: flagellar biosynthesis anti-sigma factor FlgM [Gammaproteobacteria bacterium]|nr:flagellar biosynthesis anti-sigma factor FlgM [Gammaproteobacteria bacterium]
MAKKPQQQSAQESLENAIQQSLLEQLDFTTTQKQVDALMKSVLHDTTLNANKIKFITEQLHDKRYQVNAKNIAEKMLEHVDKLDVAPAEA